MKRSKVIFILGLISTIAFLSVGCSNETNTDRSNNSINDHSQISSNEEDFSDSVQSFLDNESPKTDSSVGLLTTKINQGIELSEEQETVIQYFDNDYFSVAQYDYLQRYPQVFEGAQIHCVAQIDRVLSYSGDEYQALAFIFDMTSGEVFDEDYTNTNYIVVNGKQKGIERIIEGDILQIYGRYTSVDSYEIDGSSFLFPTIDLYETTYINDSSRFSPDFIKKVAKSIFGPNIEVRNAVAGEDYTDSEISWQFGYDPYMICELENQTNSKFTSFRFYTERGRIDDAKAASSEPMLDLFTTNIVREVEFAPDFQHYLTFTYDTDLNTLNLDYYDASFNKIWNREFSETQNAAYDYTEKALYLVANNDYYVISLEDGSDLIEPAFVGQKTRVAKIEDGVILINGSVSDTIMKIDLDGNILWKTNTNLASDNIECIQRLNGYIVIEINGGWNYIIVDENDGSLIGEIE